MRTPEYKPRCAKQLLWLNRCLALSAVGLCSLHVSTFAQSPSKKLIELGYDIPDTSYLRDNLNAMQLAEPMDGVVYSARPSTGPNQEFAWNSCGGPAVSRSSMQN